MQIPWELWEQRCPKRRQRALEEQTADVSASGRGALALGEGQPTTVPEDVWELLAANAPATGGMSV